MSWHGPSLCADSSVTLGDPVKFISAVSPSQLAGSPPRPQPFHQARDGFGPWWPRGKQNSSPIPSAGF